MDGEPDEASVMAFPWSHKTGHTRCDVIPVLDERWRVFMCPACGTAVMNEHYAEATRLLPFEQWLPRTPEPLPGFVWTGEFYERIERDPPPIKIAFPAPDGHEVVAREIRLLRQMIVATIVLFLVWLLLT